MNDMKKFQLRSILKKIRWRLVIPCCVLTILSVLFYLQFRAVGAAFPATETAATWRGTNEMRFAQIACYLPTDEGQTEDAIYTFRETLNQALVEASIESTGEGSLYTDAYSGLSSLSVSSDRASATLDAIGVGGDFFLFHPLKLISGSYLQPDDLMQDGVVLDREAAWKLFGGYDLTGMTVTIGGMPYLVMGVVERETDRYTTKEFESTGSVFLAYSALQKLDSTPITCYEVVMPNPVRQFAKNMISDKFTIGNGEIVEISSRFAPAGMLSVYKNFGKRAMQTLPLVYPYWENAQRAAENYAALYLLLAVLTILLPAFCAVFFSVRFLRRKIRSGVQNTKEKIAARIEAQKEKQLAQKIRQREKEREARETDGDTESAACEQSIR